ncbi:hypothetical protein BST83_09170 [Polaribacter filamentus]|uniref:Uncharacterized protein n=1 Tax=Polaribacter filamentus TaxID=53483 RepID=A0A2S7KXE8_9FLAO|nr:hypothetical protein [Polaribacter filamentus]PQB07307.1 hypothetical protein BST83_09170 [Polaribacter filamentus]
MNNNCIGCRTKLNFFTKPNFGGGKLSDGNRVCRNCFKALTKIDIKFGITSKTKYDSETVLKILNSKNHNELTTEQILKTSTKSIDENTSEHTFQLNAEKLIPFINQQQEQRKEEIKNFNYEPIQIQRQGIQLLESLNIIDNTKNSDTIKSRFEFVEKIYDVFIKASYNKRYITDLQIAVDEYKSTYYDKVINDYELALLVKPEFEKLSVFYGESLMKCFRRFFKEQGEQISNLKQQTAIDKRLDKILKEIDVINLEMVSNGLSTPNYDKYHSELEMVRKKILENKYRKNVG